MALPNIQHTDAANRLLDHIIEKQKLKNDAALSRLLQVAPPVISKLRHGRLAIGPTLLVTIDDVGVPFKDIREVMGVEVWGDIVWGRHYTNERTDKNRARLEAGRKV